MRLRWIRLAATFALLTLGVTILSACAGVPVSLAGIVGGVGGGLGVGLLVLFLSATQTGCDGGNLCLSIICLSLRDGGPTPSCLTVDATTGDSGELPDAGPCLRDAYIRDVGERDAAPNDAGDDPDGGDDSDAGPCLRDAASLDVRRHYGAPEPEYLSRRADERRAMIEDLKRRGVLPESVADDLGEV